MQVAIEFDTYRRARNGDRLRLVKRRPSGVNTYENIDQPKEVVCSRELRYPRVLIRESKSDI